MKNELLIFANPQKATMGAINSVEKILSADARNDGRYYSTIDDVWNAILEPFGSADWDALRRTPGQANRIPSYGPIIGGMDIDDNPALGSSRSDSIDSTIPDAKGRPSKMARGAHFIPHNKTCAVAFGPAAEMALGQNLEGDEEKTKKRHRIVVGVQETRGRKKQKKDGTGLKHSNLNKLGLAVDETTVFKVD